MLVAACGGGGSSSSTSASGSTSSSDSSASSAQGSSEQLTPVTISTLGLAYEAALPLGIKEGFFEEEGIDLTLHKVGITAPIPSVLNGSATAAFTTWGTLAVARSQELPIVGIANLTIGGGAPSAEEEDTAIVAVKGGPKTLQELKGTTVASSSLGGYAEMEIIRRASEAGVAADEMKIVAIPSPDMGAALRAGRVSAAIMSEPFITEIEETEGEENVTFLAPASSLLQTILFTSESTAHDEAALIAQLQRAVIKSVDFAAKNPELVRAVLPEYTGVSKEIAEQVSLPVFDSEIEPKSIQAIPDALVKYGLLEETVDMEPAIQDLAMTEQELKESE
ncbi:MAG: ABC transporter substrate-binding protein [Solirubrobacterales bacterium]